MIAKSSPVSQSTTFQENGGTELLIRRGVVLVVLFFSVFRLLRGVDFTDEAYYNAVAYRFVLGDKPFVDQIMVHQTAFLLFTPLVGLFHWVTGGTQGIVLFLRILFLLFNVSVAVLVYRVLRCAVDRNIALLASLFCIAFSGEWVTFCYNNLGSLFLLVGLMLEFRALAIDSTRWRLIIMGLAGLSSGLSVVSYPPLVLSTALSLGVTLAYVRSQRFPMLGVFVMGFIVATMPIIAFAWSAGWPSLISFAAATSNIAANVGQGGGSAKLLYIFEDLQKICFPNQWVEAATVIIAGLVVLFRRNFLRVVLASIVFLPLIGLDFGDWGMSFNYLVKFCLWSPLLFLVLAEKPSLIRRLFWCVCFPSLLAGFSTAWTSANGAINAGVGLIPAAVTTMVLLSLVLREALGALNVLSKITPVVVPGCVLLSILFFQFTFIYGEGTPTHLTTRVKKGPYWGLATTGIKAALSVALADDLKKYGNGRRILFYDFFPAGYLFGASRPASSTTWEYRPTRASIMGYLGDRTHWPETVFEMKAMYGHTGSMRVLSYSGDDPLIACVRSNYQLTCEKVFYRIYTKLPKTVEPEDALFESEPKEHQATTASEAASR